MRYMAKVYVSDVLDFVVVSGYVVDCDEMTSPDHESHDFTWQAPGRGVSEPLEWLLDALSRAPSVKGEPARSVDSGGLPVGGAHSVSGL